MLSQSGTSSWWIGCYSSSSTFKWCVWTAVWDQWCQYVDLRRHRKREKQNVRSVALQRNIKPSLSEFLQAHFSAHFWSTESKHSPLHAIRLHLLHHQVALTSSSAVQQHLTWLESLPPAWYLDELTPNVPITLVESEKSTQKIPRHMRNTQNKTTKTTMWRRSRETKWTYPHRSLGGGVHSLRASSFVPFQKLIQPRTRDLPEEREICA